MKLDDMTRPSPIYRFIHSELTHHSQDMISLRLQRIVDRILSISTIHTWVDQAELDYTTVHARHSTIGVPIHPGHTAVEWSGDGRASFHLYRVAVDENRGAGAASVDQLWISVDPFDPFELKTERGSH
jgi:hypothetical protein